MWKHIQQRLQHLWHDESGIIGTAAAIVMAITAGGTAASSIYGTKRAASVNERGIAAQRDESREAMALQTSEAEKQRVWEAEQRRQQREYDQGRWDSYITANQPHWQVGQQALGSLTDLAGLPGGTFGPGASGPAVGSAPATTAAGAAPATAVAGSAGLSLSARAGQQPREPTTSAAPGRGRQVYAAMQPMMAGQAPGTSGIAGFSLQDLAMLSQFNRAKAPLTP